MKVKAFSLAFSIAIVLFHTVCVCGQTKVFEELTPDNEWGEGSAMLNDGTEIKGVIRYNDKNGLVSFESGSVSRSFTPRSILGFEFFDHIVNRQRVFYTIEYDDPEGRGKRPFFFEVLKDFRTFVVLAKTNPVEIKQRVNPGGAVSNGSIMVGAGGGVTTKIYHTETVYIMNSNGQVKPYLEITRKVVDRSLYDRTKVKNKIIDDGLLKEYFVEPGYSKMIQYAAENKLDFEVKDDLLLTLDYYKQVTD